MRRLGGVLAAIAIVLGAGQAAGQSPDELARWATINTAAPAPSNDAARAAVTAAQSDCPAAGATLGVIEPVTGWRRIDEAIARGQLVNAWVVTVKRPGCPADQVFARYVLLMDPAGALSAQMVHVGRSHLDLDAFAETALPKAMRTAANTAARDVPGCSPEYVSRSAGLLRTEIAEDAALGAASYGRRQSGSWRELWMFGVCGRTLSVYLDFESTPDGTRVTVAPWASLKR